MKSLINLSKPKLTLITEAREVREVERTKKIKAKIMTRVRRDSKKCS